MTGHSRLHEFAPLGTVLRTLPGGVDSEIILLKVELNRSKPGSSWSTRWALLVTDGYDKSDSQSVTSSIGSSPADDDATEHVGRRQNERPGTTRSTTVDRKMSSATGQCPVSDGKQRRA